MAIKVLVVDDSEGLQSSWREFLDLMLSEFKDSVVILSAFSLEEAQMLFEANRNDIAIVVMDGCVPGTTLNTIPLVKYIRAMNFTGPMIACSSMPWYIESLKEAGCNHECSKYDVPRKIIEVLVTILKEA